MDNVQQNPTSPISPTTADSHRIIDNIELEPYVSFHTRNTHAHPRYSNVARADTAAGGSAPQSPSSTQMTANRPLNSNSNADADPEFDSGCRTIVLTLPFLPSALPSPVSSRPQTGSGDVFASLAQMVAESTLSQSTLSNHHQNQTSRRTRLTDLLRHDEYVAAFFKNWETAQKTCADMHIWLEAHSFQHRIMKKNIMNACLGEPLIRSSEKTNSSIFSSSILSPVEETGPERGDISSTDNTATNAPSHSTAVPPPPSSTDWKDVIRPRRYIEDEYLYKRKLASDFVNYLSSRANNWLVKEMQHLDSHIYIEMAQTRANGERSGWASPGLLLANSALLASGLPNQLSSDDESCTDTRGNAPDQAASPTVEKSDIKASQVFRSGPDIPSNQDTSTKSKRKLKMGKFWSHYDDQSKQPSPSKGGSPAKDRTKQRFLPSHLLRSMNWGFYRPKSALNIPIKSVSNPSIVLVSAPMETSQQGQILSEPGRPSTSPSATSPSPTGVMGDSILPTSFAAHNRRQEPTKPLYQGLTNLSHSNPLYSNPCIPTTQAPLPTPALLPDHSVLQRDHLLALIHAVLYHLPFLIVSIHAGPGHLGSGGYSSDISDISRFYPHVRRKLVMKLLEHRPFNSDDPAIALIKTELNRLDDRERSMQDTAKQTMLKEFGQDYMDFPMDIGDEWRKMTPNVSSFDIIAITEADSGGNTNTWSDIGLTAAKVLDEDGIPLGSVCEQSMSCAHDLQRRQILVEQGKVSLEAIAQLRLVDHPGDDPAPIHNRLIGLVLWGIAVKDRLREMEKDMAEMSVMWKKAHSVRKGV